MRVLVTGGAGFIGSHIVCLLLQNGFEVAIIDDLSSGRKTNINSKALFLEKNILWPARHSDWDWETLKKFSPQIIFHLAAQTSLLLSTENPLLDATTNILGTINVILLAKELKVKKFIMASTMAVFSKYISEPFETTQPCPERPYGIAKHAAEMYLEASGLDYAILRYGNVYGPRQVPIGENQVIARAFSHMFKATDFKIFGNGEQDRDFVYVEDVAEANLCAMEKNVAGIFHIGSGEATPINQVVKYTFTAALSTHAKNLFQDHFEFVEYGPAIQDEPPHLVVGSTRQKELGWKPKVSLTTGLKRTADWWKENEESIHPA